VRRRDVEAKLRDQLGQAGHLALGEFHHEAGQRGGIDDRVLQRAFQAAAHEPRVEGVMTVLHEHRALREPEERTPRVPEDGRSDEHRAIDVVPLFSVRVDRRAAVDQRVEEREWLLEREALGPELEHKEGRVACRLHVEGDELGLVEKSERSDLGRIDGDLLPRHELGSPAGLEVERIRPLLRAHRAIENARRANAISSEVTARSRRQAIP
jgi:hypothetical protein